MLGIVPAAGSASRLQPLGGSKELLPLGWEAPRRRFAASWRHPGRQRASVAGARSTATARPLGGRLRKEVAEPPPGRLRAVSEYLIARMLAAGADRVCLVVSSQKADLLRFYARAAYADRLFFLVQPRPVGLCDAIFRAAPFVQPGEPVLIGLPDTVWFPAAAFARGLRDGVHLITFPVDRPEEYDAVIPAAGGRVARIEVKTPGPAGRRVWGAVTAPAASFLALAGLWRRRGGREQYLGHLLNHWIAAGHPVTYDRQGTHYWDIGTPVGYQAALRARAWEPPRRLRAATGA